MDACVQALKALADPARLRVYWLLAHIDERICVAEAIDVLGVSQYNASRHLTVLKQAQLVRAKREGKWVFYTLNEEGGPFVASLLAAVREIPADGFQIEIQRCMRRLEMRQDDRCIVGPASTEWRSISRRKAVSDRKSG